MSIKLFAILVDESFKTSSSKYNIYNIESKEDYIILCMVGVPDLYVLLELFGFRFFY